MATANLYISHNPFNWFAFNTDLTAELCSFQLENSPKNTNYFGVFPNSQKCIFGSVFLESVLECILECVLEYILECVLEHVLECVFIKVFSSSKNVSFKAFNVFSITN